MSYLRYFSAPGAGAKLAAAAHYSQVVRIPMGPGNTTLVKIAGQGGWDAETGEVSTDTAKQVELAFKNVDLVLKTAGVKKGWEDVYAVRAFCTTFDEELTGPLIKEMQKWCPNHKPLLTAVGGSPLWREVMKIEIEVEAIDSSA